MGFIVGDSMKVSVIMPIFSQSTDYMITAIESVLNQTHKDIELIIVGVYGDKDTFSTISKIEDTRIKIVVSNYARVTHQRNLGIYASAGGYFLLFDSDDFLYKESIEKLLDFSIKNNTVISYPDYYKSYNDLVEKSRYKAREFDKKAILSGCYITDVSLVLRKEFMKYMPMKFSDGRSSIYSVWKKMSLNEEYAGRILHYPQPVFVYRQHSYSVCARKSENEDQFSCAVFGLNEEISDICSKFPQIILSEIFNRSYYSIYVVDPSLFVSYADKILYKRIIIHWTKNDLDTMNLYSGFKNLFHITTDCDIFRSLSGIVSNYFMLDSKEDVIGYIKEDRY